MTQDVLTGEQVWEALTKEPVFTEMAPEQWEHGALKPFVCALPDLLHDRLDKLVTFAGLTDACLIFLKHTFDNGMIDVLARKSRCPREVAEKYLRETVAWNESFVANLALCLANSSLTEQNAILNPSFGGLNRKNREKCAADALTFRDLLLSQPSIFFTHNQPKVAFDQPDQGDLNKVESWDA